MHCDYINSCSSMGHYFINNRIIEKSLKWLEEIHEEMPLGDYILGDNGYYANVHTYKTQNEYECIWESHERTVDIQYLLAGEEIIRWVPIGALSGKRKEFRCKDRIEWDAPIFNTTAITMKPGMFIIFMPREGHCPKIMYEKSKKIKKVVVKVPISMMVK